MLKYKYYIYKIHKKCVLSFFNVLQTFNNYIH